MDGNEKVMKATEGKKASGKKPGGGKEPGGKKVPAGQKASGGKKTSEMKKTSGEGKTPVAKNMAEKKGTKKNRSRNPNLRLVKNGDLPVKEERTQARRKAPLREEKELLERGKVPSGEEKEAAAKGRTASGEEGEVSAKRRTASAKGKKLSRKEKRTLAKGRKISKEEKEVTERGKRVPEEKGGEPEKGKKFSLEEKEAPANGKKLSGEEKTLAKGKELPVEEKEAPANGKKLSGEKKETLAKGKKLPGRKKEALAKGKKLPGGKKEALAKGKKLPGEEKEVSAKGKEASGKEKEVPEKGKESVGKEQKPLEKPSVKEKKQKKKEKKPEKKPSGKENPKKKKKKEGADKKLNPPEKGKKTAVKPAKAGREIHKTAGAGGRGKSFSYQDKPDIGEWFLQNKSLIIIGAMAAAVLCLLAGIFHYILTAYEVTTVYVDGNVHYTNEEVKDMVMSGRLGQNSLYLAAKYKDKGIEGIPFVEKMDVNILAPDTIRISVYEKALAGYVEYLGRYMYFDRDGIVVESSEERTAGIPQVTGLKFDYVVLNDYLPVENDEIFKRILDITQLLNKYELTADKIYFDSSYELTLFFQEVRVTLGTDEDIDQKIIHLKNILPNLEGKKGTLQMDNYTEDTKNITFHEEKN